MSMFVQCSCGKKLAVPSDHFGNQVRCPDCLAIVEIPGRKAEGEQDLAYQMEQVCTCPQCKKESPVETVICVNCGYDFQTGKKIKTSFQVQDRYVDIGTPSLGCYTRYALHREQTGNLKLTRKWYFFGLRLSSTIVDLRGYDSVVTDIGADIFGGLAPFGLIGILLRSNIQQCPYRLSLEGNRKRPFILYEGPDQTGMDEIADLLHGAGLKIRRK